MIGVVVLQEVLVQGCIMGLVTVSTFLTSRVIRMDDLTLEGSFSVGGALVAFCMQQHVSLVYAAPIGLVVGAVLGVGTGVLHEYVGINKVLSGLCMAAVLFSCNLAVVGAYASIPMQILPQLCGVGMPVIMGCIAFSVYLCVSWVLKSTLGLYMIASGHSPIMVQSVGRNPALFKVVTLALANSLAAFAGSLFVLHTGFYSITGNVGILIGALSGLLIASLVTQQCNLWLFVGACIQQAIFALIISIGLNPIWNNALKAMLIILLVASVQRNERGEIC
jgi:putative ABC transport system permease protein